MQCGYCTNGMIITAAALLATNSRPSKTEILTLPPASTRIQVSSASFPPNPVR